MFLAVYAGKHIGGFSYTWLHSARTSRISTLLFYAFQPCTLKLEKNFFSCLRYQENEQELGIYLGILFFFWLYFLQNFIENIDKF